MRIGFLSDFDLHASGYFNISTAVCSGLVENGHDVKAIGLGYGGQEHFYNFGIIPANNLMECSAIAQNLGELWGMDLLIVALDIPIQEQLLFQLRNRKFKYAGIFPLEAPPLCMTWAVGLMKMDKQFVISKFGTEELKRFGLPATHLPIGIDTESWRVPTIEERIKIRKNGLNLDDDAFVIITVADNQERKNLAAALEMFSDFVQIHPNSRYILVTRENNLVGWKLRDYAIEMDANPDKKVSCNDKLMIFERGISFKELWSLYAASDVFVLPSKAEGLGLPLLEAMSMKIPCVGTECTGISETLANDRGFMIKPEYAHRDPFGNGMRYWINKRALLNAVDEIYDGNKPDVEAARLYVEGLSWKTAVEVVCENIKEFEKEEKNESKAQV